MRLSIKSAYWILGINTIITIMGAILYPDSSLFLIPLFCSLIVLNKLISYKRKLDNISRRYHRCRTTCKLSKLDYKLPPVSEMNRMTINEAAKIMDEIEEAVAQALEDQRKKRREVSRRLPKARPFTNR